MLSNFNSIEYIGYCYKGDLKDRIILCNLEDENRLVWMKSDGEIGYDFYFKIQDIPTEEAKQFVFHHELNDYPDIQQKIIQIYLDAVECGLFIEVPTADEN